MKTTALAIALMTAGILATSVPTAQAQEACVTDRVPHPVLLETEPSSILAERLIVPAETVQTYTKRDLRAVADSRDRVLFLVEEAALMFREMRSAAERDGLSINVTSAWRSWEVQKRAYEQWLETGTNLAGNPVPAMAHPDTSSHPKGLAIDVSTVPDTLRWLRQHGPSFGWHPISSEDWHWDYKGAPTGMLSRCGLADSMETRF